ncbi:4-hydroxy-3-methylbut-2-enyl diphosphate reductase [Tistlia consotensis]|uniref:4-hydroxy-3-methylbut-2-enyl diphosphate reductase n=1 Tax=Tistlia consotensis USBA 355 TaxID=560819 RepID=A0A1Y6BBG9_9PROT|nr:4-hydroxy-3-methylbut-2-enyl diphosphate reductase [Tistlia consotensis]SME94489.1 4-hydroxy-3-methylbut-2-enyl diphosphate reductase [Tistlia consotensis USBA 355]SNR29380.1 4-hydroxy-3-methylbut-2-enyl diphosphate reductase [Tistlia consotensis]
MTGEKMTIVLANPRGFCAGVVRAIDIVERALKKFGPPVYVRHEIVHNRYVVESLEQQGAIFVDELSEVPDGYPVIFSAHGVPKSVPAEAETRKMLYVDATCPLVSKVHREAERHYKDGLQIVMIGHRGHPEVIGTLGQLPEGSILLVEGEEEVEHLKVRDPERLAYVTQTTLSVDETAGVVDALQRRFPKIRTPRKEDICYATTNRQQAVKDIAQSCEALLVVGAPNSSNSRRLVEVAQKLGCPFAALVQRATEIPWAQLEGKTRIGLTAGASAPEVLVQEVIEAFRQRFDVAIEYATTPDENVTFKLPRVVADVTAAA